MLRTTRQLQDTKADPQGRTREASGPFVERMNPIGPPPSTAAQTQANLGPLPNDGHYDQLLGRVALSFAYGLISSEDTIFSETLRNRITPSFIYGGEFVVTNNNDTLTNTQTLTFTYS